MDNNFEDLTNFNFKGFSEFLCQLNPTQYSALGSLLGIIISIPLTTSQQNSIGNFLELVGQVVLTYNAQSLLCNPQSVSLEEFEETKRNLQAQINQLYKAIKK